VASESLLIVNPASGAGAVGRRVDALVRRAESICGPVELAETDGPGDATRLACAGAERGVERILVAGGDGTTGEVVAGVLSAVRTDRPSLGILPLGSGCDFARTLGLPRDLDAALEIVAAGHARPIDAGRAELGDGRGGRVVRYFANEASAGLSGETVGRVAGLAARLGPRLGVAAGALRAVLGHAPFEAALELDDERIFEGPLSLVAVSNGCYFGAGMRVAPGARPDDGLLEVVVARGLARRELLANLPAFYLGLHGRHPRVSFHAARTLALWPASGGVPVEVDGEGGFALPLRVECLPSALRVFTPAATIPLKSGRALPVARPFATPVPLHRGRA